MLNPFFRRAPDPTALAQVQDVENPACSCFSRASTTNTMVANRTLPVIRTVEMMLDIQKPDGGVESTCANYP